MSAPVSDAALGAEQALIGVVLFDPTLYHQARQVQEHHFAEPLHGRIWRLLAAGIDAGRDVNLHVVASWLGGDPAFAETGGVRYLADLFDKCPAGTPARGLGEAVLDNWREREVAALCTAALSTIGGGTPSATVMGELRAALDAVDAEAASEADTLISARDAGAALVANLDSPPTGLRTGLRVFDGRLGGLRPDNLITLAGATSMGKTALMGCVAYGTAELNPDHQFLLHSLEMKADEVSERAQARASRREGEGVDYERIGRRELNATEKATLRRLPPLPRNLHLDTRGHVDVDAIRRRAWQLRRHGPVGAIFVDYLQLIRRPFGGGRNDAAILGDITRSLKSLAGEMDCAVVIGSQLSRELMKREDHRPRLSDLRESGAIEQDSNAVVLLHRESYYLERAEPAAGTPEHREWAEALGLCFRDMEANCAKVRGGRVGLERLFYEAEFDRITDAGS